MSRQWHGDMTQGNWKTLFEVICTASRIRAVASALPQHSTADALPGLTIAYQG
jgi:hypothetical protein